MLMEDKFALEKPALSGRWK